MLNEKIKYGVLLIMLAGCFNCSLLGLETDGDDDLSLIIAAASLAAGSATGSGGGGTTPTETPPDPCANIVDGAQALPLSLAGTSEVLTGPASGDFSSKGSQTGSASATLMDGPTDMASDGTYLYVVDGDNNRILRIDPSTGASELFAGAPDGTSTSGDADGDGTVARFNGIEGIAADCTSLFVADSSNRKIRQIDLTTRQVTTLAGPGPGLIQSGDQDGTGTSARFNSLGAITTDGTNLYVSQNSKIRKVVIATGQVTTILGPPEGVTANGDVDANGNNARFGNGISGLSYTGGNLYIADRGNNKIRRANLTTLDVTVFAGPAAGSTSAGDVDGTGTAARFFRINNLVSDGTRLYVTEGDGILFQEQIRHINLADAVVTTFLGDQSGDLDGTGAAARLANPDGMTVLGGRLYVTVTHKVRVIR